MELKDRLLTIFIRSGVSSDDAQKWQKAISVLPFDKQEVFVYLVERLTPEDISFLNKNFTMKIDAFLSGEVSESVMNDIIEEEKKYLRA